MAATRLEVCAMQLCLSRSVLGKAHGVAWHEFEEERSEHFWICGFVDLWIWNLDYLTRAFSSDPGCIKLPLLHLDLHVEALLIRQIQFQLNGIGVDLAFAG